MKNYVTSVVLEEAPCVNSSKISYNSNYSLNYNIVLKKDMIVILKTDKGIFYAEYNRIPTSLIHELASMKAGDKIDIFFRIDAFEGKKHRSEFLKSFGPIKFFYDVKIHEGGMMRFKQCLWHEEIPIIAEVDLAKVKFGLPLEKAGVVAKVVEL